MRWLLLLLSCLQLCMLASLSSTLRPVGLPGSNLPAEWKTARDRQGREYYYHARTKKATWTYPERKSLIFNNFPIETTILPNFFLLRVRPAEEFVSLLENKTKAVVVFHLPLAVRDPYFNNSFTRLSQTQRYAAPATVRPPLVFSPSFKGHRCLLTSRQVGISRE
eukprot:755256-Hanusia_phi.AAC.5